MTNVAIVTGASSGVGREFVRQLDLGKGGPLDEIWLIARSTDRLEQIAEETVTDCRVFALDLTKDSSFLSVRDALEADDSIRVQWLINSAGYGKFGRLDEISSQDNADMTFDETQVGKVIRAMRHRWSQGSLVRSDL